MDTAINWGRYAELYAFDGTREQLSLEDHPAHASAGADVPATQTRRGVLRVYLGAYPGSGKTFAMLRDAHHRRAAGEDVVVAALKTRDRLHTEEAIGDLERIEPATGTDGQPQDDVDVDAVIARHPQVALVDDLAHLNAPGAAHPWRWQEVEALLDAGIDVLTTLDAWQIESQRESVEHITGEPVAVTVPDRLLDGTTDVQFVDIAPGALQRRVSHGNVCPRDEIEAALAGPYRMEVLGSLRELALRYVARRLGGGAVPARLEPQDVVVAVGSSPQAESLVRRGSRLARRTGGICTVVTVGPRSTPAVRATVEQLGATFTERPGGDVAKEVRATVREVGAQHLVVGASDPRQRLRMRRTTLTDRLIETLPDVDVHVIARLLPRTTAKPTASEDDDARFVRRGTLRVYLGYARGCGTTTAMLDEARRRASRGTDCVVAAIAHFHPGVDADLADLEIAGGGSGVPSRPDVDAMLARNPQVVCIDDLASASSAPAELRMDLDRLLDAGITVIATLHAADPMDEPVLDLIDDIELVDVPASLLVERVRAGEIVPRDQVDAALRTEFRDETLARLREQAFRMVAWHADHQQILHLRRQGETAQWEARPRVMACVAERPGMERLIRRAAGLAASLDTDFRSVTVRTGDSASTEVAGRYAALTTQLGGQVVTLADPAIAPALARYARENLVTELLITRESRGGKRAGATVRELIRTHSEVDIHILSAG